jgi:hypothetical protein
MTPIEAATVIEEFLDGTGEKWDWDDFIHAKIEDPRVDVIRQICNELDSIYPGRRAGEYCGPKGEIIMRGLVKELRSMS